MQAKQAQGPRGHLVRLSLGRKSNKREDGVRRGPDHKGSCRLAEELRLNPEGIERF